MIIHFLHCVRLNPPVIENSAIVEIMRVFLSFTTQMVKVHISKKRGIIQCFSVSNKINTCKSAHGSACWQGNLPVFLFVSSLTLCHIKLKLAIIMPVPENV